MSTREVGIKRRESESERGLAPSPGGFVVCLGGHQHRELRRLLSTM